MKFLKWLVVAMSLVDCLGHDLDRKTILVRNLTDILLHMNTRFVEPALKVASPNLFVTVVRISMSLRNLIDFDVSRGKLQLFVAFKWIWKDKSLEWNQNEYPVNNLLLPRNKIWIPIMYIQNSAASIQPLGESESVLVKPNGICTYNTPEIIDVLCSSDVSKFPFDAHVCVVVFDLLLEENIFRVEMDEDVSQADMWENSVWNLTFLNVTHKRDNIIEVYLIVERYAFFLMLNLVAPVLILSIMNLFVFILPQESGERMSFSITVLLSFVVFITFTSESLPESRNAICVFNMYLLVELVQSALITLSIIFLSFLFNTAEDKTIPKVFLLLFCRKARFRVNPIKKKDEGSEAKGQTEIQSDDKDPVQNEDKEECPLTWSKVTLRLNNGCLVVFTMISLITKLVTFGIIAS